MTASATITAAKTVARLLERQSSIVSPQPDGKCRDRGEQDERERKFVPARRLLGLAGAACRRLLALRGTHHQTDQERKHADDQENDHRLDEDGRSMLQGLPRPFLLTRRRAAFESAAASK
jgi:hypothetical protein